MTIIIYNIKKVIYRLRPSFGGMQLPIPTRRSIQLLEAVVQEALPVQCSACLHSFVLFRPTGHEFGPRQVDVISFKTG